MAIKTREDGPKVEYLELAGWTFEGDGWRDPESRKPKTINVIKVRHKNEEKEVRQVVLPPSPLLYDLEQAYNVQRTRDEAKELEAQVA